LPGLHVDALDAAGHRRRDLHGRLVRLHLEQRRVLAHDVALAHEHLTDLGLGQPLAEVGQHESTRHGWTAVYNFRVSRAVDSARATWGRLPFSRAEPGNGSSHDVAR